MMHEALNFHTKRIFLSGRNEFNLFQKIHQWFWLIFHCMEFPEKFDNEKTTVDFEFSKIRKYVASLFSNRKSKAKAPPVYGHHIETLSFEVA
jgi:hypothetical protein